ncbi:skin secretory protein xP2-like isoform X2 [Melanerpes formicivorus]|uniref:skin secretory protein xP2-like isoform X2 n=1 Tax=Melanerpes formicivorus TaxID=211600 RepID=UPI00358FA209
MGCSSSARSRPEELPPAAAAPPPRELRAAPGANTPPAADHETIADQRQLDPGEDVSLAAEETKLGKHLLGEEAAAVVLAVEGKIDWVGEREEPEGTEPLPPGAEESCRLPAGWPEESQGPSPPAPGEDAESPAPGPAEDSGLAEGYDSSVEESMEKVHVSEEEQLAEGPCLS